MTLSTALLRAPRIGARQFRNKACAYIRKGKFYLITEHGKPAGVFMPYDEAVNLTELLDELHDKELLKTIAEGRKAVRSGAKGVSLEYALNKRKIRV